MSKRFSHSKRKHLKNTPNHFYYVADLCMDTEASSQQPANWIGVWVAVCLRLWLACTTHDINTVGECNLWNGIDSFFFALIFLLIDVCDISLSSAIFSPNFRCGLNTKIFIKVAGSMILFLPGHKLPEWNACVLIRIWHCTNRLEELNKISPLHGIRELDIFVNTSWAMESIELSTLSEIVCHDNGHISMTHALQFVVKSIEFARRFQFMVKCPEPNRLSNRMQSVARISFSLIINYQLTKST